MYFAADNKKALECLLKILSKRQTLKSLQCLALQDIIQVPFFLRSSLPKA